MNKSMVIVVLALILPLGGCVNAAMIAATAIGTGLTNKKVTEAKAERCYKVETQADEEKVSKAERNRRLTAANCPLS